MPRKEASDPSHSWNQHTLRFRHLRLTLRDSRPDAPGYPEFRSAHPARGHVADGISAMFEA